MYPIIDLHCDALYKMQANKEISFYDSPELDVNYINMKKGGVKAQAFAIFVHPELPVEDQYVLAKEQVSLFYDKVLTTPGMKHIRSWHELSVLKEDEIGAFLTIEGVGPIGNQIDHLNSLIDDGVLVVGLTWNPANLAADGIMEPRNGGLTIFGKEIVSLLNERKIICDVSHLSHQSFEDVLDLADYVIASHSNCFTLCNHPRNLTDHQIDRMIKKRAMIHIVFNPPFLTGEDAYVEDVLAHIDYLRQLGADHLIGFGSDFDGIRTKVSSFTNWSQADNLFEALSILPTDITCSIGYDNFINYLVHHHLLVQA